MRQIVLDTETTGLSVKDNHRIIEIGAIELIDREPTGNNLHYYINPQRDVDDGAIAIHGLKRSFLEDKPTFTIIATQLINYLQGAELIIHNAGFDLAFLDYELKLLGESNLLRHYCPHVIDTLAVARKKHPGQQNSLDALCRRYQVDNTDRTLHGALLDAKLLTQVYLAMTGGQRNLLLDEGNTSGIHAVTKASNYKTAGLIIQKADAKEAQEHHQYLETIKKASGKCLWPSSSQPDN